MPGHFVRGQIVEDEDVSGPKMRREFLLYVLDEDFAIQGAIDNQRGEESVEAQGGHEGGGFPVTRAERSIRTR